MRKVVVAGGAGFIGSHLCERLAQQGDQVTCVDLFPKGGNKAPRGWGGWIKTHHHDVRSPTVDRCLLEANEIYNLACPASPVHYQRTPVQTAEIAFVGTLNLLSCATQSGARYFQASTSEVYGDPVEHPQTEAYRGRVSPYGPRACYDEGKRAAEALCFSYEQEFGTEVRIARIFNTYGPRMRADDGRVIPSLICAALRGEDIPINGDGLQTRSFCYVSDLVDGIISLMRSELRGPVNLGNPHEISMMELADLILQLTKGASRFEFRPMPTDDPVRRCPDISLAVSVLGWAPSTPLRDGLMRTIASFYPEE